MGSISSARRARRRIGWLLGVASLALLVTIVLNRTEEEKFLRLVEGARPAWLGVAALLQGLTYFCQARIFKHTARSMGAQISRPAALRLSFTKLFGDQALPFPGSGTIFTAQALTAQSVPRKAIAEIVVVNTTAYYGASLAMLSTALLLLAGKGVSPPWLLAAFVLFMTGAGALVFGLRRLETGQRIPAERLLGRVPGYRQLKGFFAAAATGGPGRGRRLADAALMQIFIFALDVATLWCVVTALGETAPIKGLFISFMLASLAQSVAMVPGGLGVFEAASAAGLALTGLSGAAALSATIVFRGFTFWLPLLPGFALAHKMMRPHPAQQHIPDYWAEDAAVTAARLESSAAGLSAAEAATRLAALGSNEIREARPLTRTRVLLDQLRSPLLLLLLFAAIVSLITAEWFDASLVLLILSASVFIGFNREYKAQVTARDLAARIRLTTCVLREGHVSRVDNRAVVPGDVILLSAGTLVPADAVVLEAANLFVNEAVLTGESLPVEKRPGVAARDASLPARTNCVFQGTNVRSGTARCLVTATGRATELGAIAHRIAQRPAETEFERGLRRFGDWLLIAMLIMSLVVFAGNVMLGRPIATTLLFSIALAVGLSPELLPAILSVNLARGAQRMAGAGVLVKRLNAIENLGSMDTLCTDKTGTLTEGTVRFEGAWDAAGQPSADVARLAFLNARLQTGLSNPLDEALSHTEADGAPGAPEKLGEIPYDFERKRMSVVVADHDAALILCKGAVPQVLDACTRTPAGPLTGPGVTDLRRRFDEWSRQGRRVLAVATRRLPRQAAYGLDDEHEMTFEGFLTFQDNLKENIGASLAALAALGVRVKLITGDVRLVAQHVAESVGIRSPRVLTGRQIRGAHDDALRQLVETNHVFAEIEPAQKERILTALRQVGHVVGFLGDGVNDAPAMHVADASLSVDGAVDVARDAADFVLLQRDLMVIHNGIVEGRKTFANSLKYILITTSANLGNMISMAVAALFLPFLPLLAGQVLLNNFLSDIPAIGIAGDRVDPEYLAAPRRWNLNFIGWFMVEFGLLSSAFDFLTFGVLLYGFHAGAELFHTGWFVESLLTELAIIMVLRTRRSMFRSRPSALLVWLTAGVTAAAVATPYLPVASWLGFVRLPPLLLAFVLITTLLYAAASEVSKNLFYRHAEAVHVRRKRGYG